MFSYLPSLEGVEEGPEEDDDDDAVRQLNWRRGKLLRTKVTGNHIGLCISRRGVKHCFSLVLGAK